MIGIPDEKIPAVRFVSRSPGGAIVLVLPTPSGMSDPAKSMLAVAAFTITVWLFQVMNNAVASVLMMGLMVLLGAEPQLVLSGFSSPSFWILLCVLYYGCAMDRTGLAHRLSYYVPVALSRHLHGDTFRLFRDRPGAGIRNPFHDSAYRHHGTDRLGTGEIAGNPAAQPRSALIVVTSIEMAVLPGCAILYGSLFGPVVASVFQTKQLPLSWIGYAQAMSIPLSFFAGLSCS